MQYYEDVEIGKVSRFGAYPVERDAVMDFAAAYDPQPFHLDDAAAEQTYFGRLSASGWHTACMVMRMVVDEMQAGEGRAGLGSPGIDELRWVKPVYPGDTLRCESVVTEKRRSRSRPEMGIIKTQLTAFNQHDEVVMTYIANGLVATRDPGGSD